MSSLAKSLELNPVLRMKLATSCRVPLVIKWFEPACTFKRVGCDLENSFSFFNFHFTALQVI